MSGRKGCKGCGGCPILGSGLVFLGLGSGTSSPSSPYISSIEGSSGVTLPMLPNPNAPSILLEFAPGIAAIPAAPPPNNPLSISNILPAIS